ncbi:hypothetical protein JVT61DRAFT_9907 [Boletus reticuloceps]|uniref:Uncharacterized protein n=1 Tax=Boletus reticuloceps TaxID=495285 RepID=A0A8I2YFR3_9AGAM|nr:hypothetical protein JVT61DRAFT_9907 [Boletus reticuloceps]
MVIEQWKMAVKGKKYIGPWTTYSAALLAKLWALLVENCWSYLLPLAWWAKNLSLGSAKLTRACA